MIVVVIGAAGAGKTTVGRALAAALGWAFADADDYHSAASIARMRDGLALAEEDREPWLERVHGLIAATANAGTDLVLACSALRERYRARLSRDVEDVRWVYLRASRTLLHQRLVARRGHFAGRGILDDQLAILEEPAGAIWVEADQPVDAIVRTIRTSLLPPGSRTPTETRHT